MSNKTFALPEELYKYMLSISLREPEALEELRKVTAKREDSSMQVAPEQGQFMGELMHLMNAKRVIEIGMYTGYSSIAMALAMPKDGKIITCDINMEFAGIAKTYFEKAGVADKIEQKIQDAIITLDELIESGKQGHFDAAFIDADKGSYEVYYDKLYELIRSGGLIMIDNIFWDGKTADEQNDEADTIAIRKFNEKLKNDKRIRISTVPIGDGLTMAVKI
ncbi:class I SAM-dependent methyltransferase [Spirochaetota bacterium]